MDIKKVLEIAERCGTSVRGHYDETGCTPQELHKFATEVARIEREECARISEKTLVKIGNDILYCDDIASAIRNKA